MPGKTKANKKAVTAPKKVAKTSAKRPVTSKKPAGAARVSGVAAAKPVEEKKPTRSLNPARREALHRMLMAKRQEILAGIGASLGQSLTDDQQRRLESAMDVGDQAMMDLERELGISLLEMQNRKRQMIDEALARLDDGSYGLCAECSVEISEKRLAVVPFAKLCVACQSQQELIEKIEKGEERD
ncbi:MAG: hypothetical protein FJ246_07345 [Nitrospira sp.]|nr:hypothetical protein [Nitrospira sp.]